MSLLLNCQKITKSILGNIIFRDLNFSIFKGDKLGLIGINGAGKSTLLKALNGQDDLDSGEITKVSGLTVSYVPQIQSFDEGSRVVDVLTESAKAKNLPNIDAQVRKVGGKCGFNNLEVSVGSLSGGWRKRLSLACGFLDDAELLLLDEPTNHLDLEGIIWLEELLKNSEFSFVLVSHDRAFLDNSTNKIAEISKVYPLGIKVYDGDLQNYKVKRASFLESEQRKESSLKNKVRREKDWLSRGPKARTTKSKSRIDKAHDLMQELSSVSSRLDVRKTDIDFAHSSRKTKELFEAINIGKSYGEKIVLNSANFSLVSNMKLGVVGPNGSGKSTILKIISGDIKPDSGNIKKASNLKTVYFQQDRSKLNPDFTVKETLAPDGDSVIYMGREIHVVGWASRFQFWNEKLHTKVSNLSGGEQARLLIAKLMLEEADLLILDEPTNDLDIETLEVLEESLGEFSGAVVLVSHDRYLMSNVCTNFIGLDGEGGVESYADFEQWLRSYRGKKQPNKVEDNSKKISSDSSITNKERYKLSKEHAKVERLIEKAELKVEELKTQIEHPKISSDPEKLKIAIGNFENSKADLANLYQEWERLETLLS